MKQFSATQTVTVTQDDSFPLFQILAGPVVFMAILYIICVFASPTHDWLLR